MRTTEPSPTALPLHDFRMFDVLARFRLPLLLLSLLFVIGGSRFEALRPFEGEVIGLGLPIVTVCAGVAPFRDAHSGLRNGVFAFGAGVVLLVEAACYRAVFEGEVASPSGLVLALLALSAIGSLLFEVAGARRGLRTRLSAWLGIALVFAVFFPRHVSAQNLFGSVFAAFIVSLLVGGGSGLFGGEMVVRAARG